MKSSLPNRTMLSIAGLALVLISFGIAINYFRGGEIRFAHLLLALGLLAYIVWFSGRPGAAK